MPTGNAQFDRSIVHLKDHLRLCQYIARLIYSGDVPDIIGTSPLLCVGHLDEVNPMGKSTSGPDWTDVAMMMGALEALHGCRVGLTGLTDTALGAGQLSIALNAQFDVLPSGQLPPIIQVLSVWPCKDCSSLAAHVYGGLYKLDFAIGEAYQQRFLPGV